MTTAEELHKAIEEHLEYICKETLAVYKPIKHFDPEKPIYQKIVMIDGQPLLISIQKV